ncbi:MAG: hypothetical protein UHH95_01505 [Oscillospiraceae bacterium]|nr:hypothetical protein [Oscillospiraceae bacterium]
MIQVIIILILILVFCLLKLSKCSDEETLRKYVCFCCAKNDEMHRGAISLFGHILNIQNDLQTNIKIKKRYRILYDDNQYINELLEKFSDNLLQSYFDKGLDVGIKESTKLTKEEFLMIYLWVFLRNDRNFIFEHEKMYTLGEIPNGENYRELHLTDYSLAYYKLFYITQLYCHNSNNIMKHLPDLCYENPEGTKEIIDTKIKKHYIS